MLENATGYHRDVLDDRSLMLKDMGKRYLEVTYRDGKPVAAYLYLQRQSGDRSVRT